MPDLVITNRRTATLPNCDGCGRFTGRIESLIGALLPAPLTCASEHLPATYNPWADQTWCLCGSHTWPGLTPVLHKSVSRRDGLGPNASIVGWDTYTLDTPHIQGELP